MIDLTGQALRSVSVDEAGTLSLRTDGGWVIDVSNDYALTVGDVTLATQGGEESLIVTALQEWVGAPLDGCTVTGGTLEVSVGSGTLRVTPHRSYEAWTIAGPDQQLVVSMPGGELATWGMSDG